MSQTVDNVATNYTLDMNLGLTQVLDDGVNSYTYGLGRISQLNTATLVTDYFLGDALGSVRQMTNSTGDITLAKSYDPYGNVTHTTGNAQSNYGFTGETTDSNGLVYLRARYYNPLDGRFMSGNPWGGNGKSLMSMNRWMYVEGNPVNYTDPSGNMPEVSKQMISNNFSFIQTNLILSGENNLLDLLLGDCPRYSKPVLGRNAIRYDLTGYLAESMNKHGQDPRVKSIRYLLGLANVYGKVNDAARTALWISAYVSYNELEGGGKEWLGGRKTCRFGGADGNQKSGSGFDYQLPCEGCGEVVEGVR